MVTRGKHVCAKCQLHAPLYPYRVLIRPDNIPEVPMKAKLGESYPGLPGAFEGKRINSLIHPCNK